MAKRIHLTTVAIACTALMACASQSPTTTPKPALRAGESVVIEATRFERIDLSVESQGARTGKAVAVGAIAGLGGAVAGGMVGSGVALACGPGFVICNPITAVVGAGAVGLGVAHRVGTQVGVNGISGDHADLFNATALSLADTEMWEDRLHGHFVETANKHWLVANAAPNSMRLNLHHLRFEQLSFDRVKVIAVASLTVSLDDGARNIRVNYRGKQRFVKDLASQDGLIEKQIDKALDSIVLALAKSLQRPYRGLAKDEVINAH